MDWSLALWAGIVGGLAMGVWAMMMHFFGVTRLSVPQYLGCIVTGKHEGAGNYMVGMMIHLMLSIIVAFVYAWFFESEWVGEATWLTGLLLGVGHWLVGGLMLPLLDAMNGCVKRGAIPAIETFGKGYGGAAVATFFVGHLIFGAVVGAIYETTLF